MVVIIHQATCLLQWWGGPLIRHAVVCSDRLAAFNLTGHRELAGQALADFQPAMLKDQVATMDPKAAIQGAGETTYQPA